MREGRRGQGALVIALSLLCFVTFLPFMWVVLTAFKPNTEIYALDKQILPGIRRSRTSRRSSIGAISSPASSSTRSSIPW
jgi:ABC-type glycerol-3-phosphate transport system permease component